MPLAPLAGYSPHPSAPSLADLGDAQGLLADSQASSTEAPFRSTSLQALAGTWTIPFNELVGCCWWLLTEPASSALLCMP